MLPKSLDLWLAAGSLGMAVVETIRWRRGTGKPGWAAFYVALGLAFLGFALFEK